MRFISLLALIALISSCVENKGGSQNKSKTTSTLENEASLKGLRKVGLTFEEIANHNYEAHFAIGCEDNDEFTNLDRLNRLEEFYTSIITKHEKQNSKIRYKFEACYSSDLSCSVNNSDMKKLTQEAIKTLQYFSSMQESKYCPTNILTKKGMLIEETPQESPSPSILRNLGRVCMTDAESRSHRTEYILIEKTLDMESGKVLAFTTSLTFVDLKTCKNAKDWNPLRKNEQPENENDLQVFLKCYREDMDSQKSYLVTGKRNLKTGIALDLEFMKEYSNPNCN
jgi:hypothetical protein